MKRRDAFTLTELLVLVAIGTVAGTVLLASLGDAKTKVVAAACTSNLREVSLALRLYTDDHNGFMPPASYGAGSTTWPKRLNPYLPQRGPNPTSPPNRVFVCPRASYSGYQNIDLSLTYSCTAAMLGRASPPGGDILPGSTVALTATQPRKVTQVYTSPSETPLVVEGKRDPAGIIAACRSNTPWNVPYASLDLSVTNSSLCYYLDFRHNDAMNIAFFDGSVRLVTFAQATNQFTKTLWEGR
jgi:prepilin-type processing-associated H-X9-DG protein